MANASNTTAPTQFIETKLEKYAYRRFGKGSSLPLLCLQHFTGTLDNWDPAVTDPLAVGREVILFESAGLGRSTGQVPESMAGMAAHALAFVDALDLKRLDILGYSPRWNGRAADRAGASLACSQNAACRHRSGGRRGHYAYGETGTQKDYGRSEHAWAGETGKALLRAKQVESSGRRGLRNSARPKKAR